MKKVIIAKTPIGPKVQYQGAWNIGKGGLSLHTIENADYLVHVKGAEDGHVLKGIYIVDDYGFCNKQNKVMFDAGRSVDQETFNKIAAVVNDENLAWNGPLKVLDI